MTVLEQLYDTVLGADREEWTALLDHLETTAPWLVAGVALAVYGVVYALAFFVTASAALYLAAIVPGVAGAAVFFTAGLAIIATAPVAARRLFIRALDEIEKREAERGEGRA